LKETKNWWQICSSKDVLIVEDSRSEAEILNRSSHAEKNQLKDIQSIEPAGGGVDACGVSLDLEFF